MRIIGMTFAAALAACGAEAGKGSGDEPAGEFALDSQGFVVQGTRWWTSTSGPLLAGTIDSDGGTLAASIAGQTIGNATIANGRWSLQLPDGSIAASDTAVTLVLSAPGKQPVSEQQIFDLDDGKPAITIAAKVYDERGDTIAFAPSGPVHTHEGPLVDLSTGCPDVYKYAYLTSGSVLYGSESTPNPLAFRVSAASPAGIDPAATSWRVRAGDGSVLADWSLLAPDATGAYTIALQRDGDHAIPQLATRDGGMYFDVRYHDSFGHEAIASACFSYHPLAAPLQMMPIAAESQGEALSGMLLGASPISDLLNSSAIGAPRVAVVGQRFVQYTADPVLLDLAFEAPLATWSKTISTRYVLDGTGTIACGTSTSYSTDPRCNPAATTTGSDNEYNGTVVAAWPWSAQIVDDATGAAVSSCNAVGMHGWCTVPARAPAAGPHAYRMVLMLDGVKDLWPAASDPFGEYMVAFKKYTGVAPQTLSKCDTQTATTILGVTSYSCSYGVYSKIVALGKAMLTFTGFHSTLKTSVATTVALAAPPSGSVFDSDPLFWNAGAAVLPGL